MEGAFLNGLLKEELYVKDVHATGKQAWKLLKSLYGTKQAAHNWNKVINDILKGLGFKRCSDDPGLYYREKDRGMIIIHLDDLLCAFNSIEAMEEWITAMRKHFTLEDHSTPSRFLGTNLLWIKTGVIITGESTIQVLVQNSAMHGNTTKKPTTPYLVITEIPKPIEPKAF